MVSSAAQEPHVLMRQRSRACFAPPLRCRSLAVTVASVAAEPRSPRPLPRFHRLRASSGLQIARSLQATPACPARPDRSQSLPCSAGSTSSRPTSSGCRCPSAAATPPATTSSCAKGSPSASQAFPKCSRDHEQHKRTQSKVDDNGHNPWPSLLNFQVHRFGLHAEQLPVISGQYDTQSGYLGGIFFTTLGRGSWPCATADKS